MNEDIVVPIAGMMMIIVLALGIPLIRAFARKWEVRGSLPSVPPDVEDRLARMEQAIDAIAVEIERVAEGQRFTTKLLSDRERVNAALPPSEHR